MRVDLPSVRELVADIREDNPPGLLTDQVRLPSEQVKELAASLRAAAGL